jgi:hypothetical protein
MAHAMPEKVVARDIVKRGMYAAPVLIALCAAIWGTKGAASSAYAIALVCVNFLLAAAIITFTARISLAFLAGGVLFGYLARLALIFVAVLLVRHTGWYHALALGLTIIVTHLGLLVWELKYVAISLAYPALKPGHPLRTTEGRTAS